MDPPIQDFIDFTYEIVWWEIHPMIVTHARWFLLESEMSWYVVSQEPYWRGKFIKRTRYSCRSYNKKGINGRTGISCNSMVKIDLIAVVNVGEVVYSTRTLILPGAVLGAFGFDIGLIYQTNHVSRMHWGAGSLWHLLEKINTTISSNKGYNLSSLVICAL